MQGTWMEKKQLRRDGDDNNSRCDRSNSRRASDLDLDDVYGGPPSRCLGFSGSSWRHSDSSAVGVSSSRRSPYVGDDPSPSFRLRCHLADDFFGDIFRGGDDDSASSTQSSRDLVVLDRRGSFSGASSPQSHLSCSQKMIEQPGFPEFFTSLDDTVIAKEHKNLLESHGSATVNIRRLFKEDSTNLAYNKSSSTNCHFSIFKSACKSAVLPVSPISKVRSQNNVKFSGSPVPSLQEVEMTSKNKDINFVEMTSDVLNQDNGLSTKVSTEKKDATEIQYREGNLPCKFQTMPLRSDASTKSDIKQVAEEEDPLTTANSSRSNNIAVEIKGQKLKKTLAVQSDASDIPFSLEDKVISGRIREKFKNFLKNFLKNFHLVLSCKPISYIEPQSRTFKVKEVGNNKLEGSALVYEINVAVEEKINLERNGGARSNASMVIEEIPRTEKPEAVTLAVDREVLVGPREGDGAAIHNIDSILENMDELYTDMEEPHYNFEECMVESLHWEHDGLSLSDSNLKEFQNTDLILREWSSGKEGNIRSLLSTLQDVIWPASGWKPVPLADLVEGTSVKKAYLKALLSLHPDKLQQRGVPTHQKHIAEKVFDILQEAWSEFTSVTHM